MALATAPASAQQVDGSRLVRAPGTSTAESLDVAQSYPGLLQRAQVAPEAAARIALAKVKDGAVESMAIEDRGNRLVYVIRVKSRPGKPRELLVDAETGRVLSNRKLARDRP